jgi:hypothetical protein
MLSASLNPEETVSQSAVDGAAGWRDFPLSSSSSSKLPDAYNSKGPNTSMLV